MAKADLPDSADQPASTHLDGQPGVSAVAFRRKLLRWFGKEGRSFVWRRNPAPFTVLMAEILLKKTGAAVVDRFLPGFLARYPDTYTLSGATIDQLMTILAPLGLSTQRARQFKALGEALSLDYGGEVPCDRDRLLALPGVGEYTAGAVLSFACGKPEPIVDTNVARVIVRVFGIRPSRFEARRSPEVWQKARELVGRTRRVSAEVNWALLDLGALICTPRRPKCRHCPLNDVCASAYSINGNSYH